MARGLEPAPGAPQPAPEPALQPAQQPRNDYSKVTSADSNSAETSQSTSLRFRGTPSGEVEADVRAKIEHDLQIWHEKFAKAAEKGAEDLEERIKEIVDRQIKSQAHGVGTARTTRLSESQAAELRMFGFLMIVGIQFVTCLVLTLVHDGDTQYWTEEPRAQILKLTLSAALTQVGFWGLGRKLGDSDWWMIILAFIPVTSAIIVNAMLWVVS